jgi:hypothetical protein
VIAIQRRGFRKMAFAVVEVNFGADSDNIDDQIEIAIAIDIRQGRSTATAGRSRQTCVCSDVFKFPIAEISIENVAPVDAAEKNIAPSIAIGVAKRDTRTVQEYLVRHVTFERKHVGKCDSRLRWLKAGETSSASGKQMNGSASTGPVVLPIQRSRRECNRRKPNRQSESKQSADHGDLGSRK